MPKGAVLAHEDDRKYMLEEFGRQFAGETVPMGNECVWVLDKSECEVAICLSLDARSMWVWRQGR